MSSNQVSNPHFDQHHNPIPSSSNTPLITPIYPEINHGTAPIPNYQHISSHSPCLAPAQIPSQSVTKCSNTVDAPPIYAPPNYIPSFPQHTNQPAAYHIQDHHHHTIKPSNPVYGTLPSPSMVPSVMVPVQSIEYLKETPAVIKCPFCHETAWTELDYTVGKLTIISSMLLFAFGCHTGGCLIPLAVPQCRNVVHSCTSCHTKLAIYKRLEGKTELLTTD